MELFSSTEFEQVLEYLRERFDGYPYDDGKDRGYFWQLFDDFSKELNILEELKQYQAWTLDQPPEKKIHYRSRFRSWLKTALQFRRYSMNRPHWLVKRHVAGR